VINQIRGTVTYEDGSVVPWQARPRDLKAMESYARRQGIEVREGALSPTLAMFLAYSALRVEEGFDVWLDRLDDFEDLTGDELVDPFPRGASLER
jgi:hypothetical protein